MADLFQVVVADAVKVVELSLPLTMDSKDFDRLNDSLLALVSAEPGGRWVLDLSALNYMGSSVLGLMVNIRQRIRMAGGVLVLCGMSPRLAQIFHTCSLERLFKITKTRTEAVASACR